MSKLIIIYWTKMKTIEVVAAIVVNDGKTLCAQRGKNKLDYLSEKI